MYLLLIAVAIAAPQEDTGKKALEKVRAYEQAMNIPEIDSALRLKDGLVFRLPDQNEVYVVYIRDERSMVVRHIKEFWLKGVSTKGVIDGRLVRVPGLLKVTGTDKFGGNTIFVAEPYEPPGKPSPRDHELARKEEAKNQTAENARARAEATRKAEEAKVKAAVEREQTAASKLKFAKTFLADGMKDAAKRRLRELVKDFADTKASAEATRLLTELEK